MTSQVFVVSALRTSISTFDGSLKDLSLLALATHVVNAVLQASGVRLAAVGRLVMSAVIPAEPRDVYLGRVAALQAGLSNELPAFNMNRLYGSGLQAIISAYQLIASDNAEVAIAAGPAHATVRLW